MVNVLRFGATRRPTRQLYLERYSEGAFGRLNRRMLDTARGLIVKEIAIARGHTEEDVKSEIESIFFTN